MTSVRQQSVDSDIWISDYLKPSWVCLPNNKPVLAIVQPGEMTLDVLSSVCKVGHSWNYQETLKPALIVFCYFYVYSHIFYSEGNFRMT